MTVIGLVGYGEVGRILAEDLRALSGSTSDRARNRLPKGAKATDFAENAPSEVDCAHDEEITLVAYDLKLGTTDGEALEQHAAERGVQLLDDHAAVAREADLVISAVTASQTVAVAEALAPGIKPDTFVLDMNSASPGAKQEAFQITADAGGRYVEGAVMTSVPPHRIHVPILLGGPHAEALSPLLAELGFTGATVHDKRLGIASATKLSRSVMIKGIEALFVESLTTARHFGVEDAVIASFNETFPGIDWEAQATWFFRRAIEHGKRRSEEMAEAARTVEEAGLEPLGATASSKRQGWLGDKFRAGELTPTPDWRTSADAILTQIKKEA